jgi:hypothetical protein
MEKLEKWVRIQAKRSLKNKKKSRMATVSQKLNKFKISCSTEMNVLSRELEASFGAGLAEFC